MTFPGIFLASVSSFTAFSKSFSRNEHFLSCKNICKAVLDALPRFPLPGVNLTLNLECRFVNKLIERNNDKKYLLVIMKRLIRGNDRHCKQKLIFVHWNSSQSVQHVYLVSGWSFI